MEHKGTNTEVFETEQEAFAEEIKLIAFYGRLDEGKGSLWNKTNGGDGFHGVHYWKGKVGNKKGMRHSQETIEKIRQAKLGKPCSEETKMKISKTQKGRSYEDLWGKEKAEEIKKKVGDGSRGHTAWNKGLDKNDPRVAKCYSNRKRAA